MLCHKGSDGGIGRHAGLKIQWAAMPVRVQVPLRVRVKQSLLSNESNDFCFYVTFENILTMETAVTFATSDVGKLNSIKDFIRSLNVSIIQEEDIPQPIEMTPRLMKYLEELEADNTSFDQCEDSYVMVNRLASKYGLTLQN